MATSSEGIASQTFRKHFADLVEAIQDPDRIALKLYANDVILRSTRDEVTMTVFTREQKNTKLLAAVESQLHVSPDSFQVFLSVLKERPPLEGLCMRIEEAYRAQKPKVVSGDCAREPSSSSAEPVSHLPNPTSGSIGPSSSVPQSDTHTSSIFPYLDMGKLSQRDRLALQSKLLKDSDAVISEFSDLIHYTITSIASQVSVLKLRTRLSSLGSYRPTRDPVSLLRNHLDEIRRTEDVEEVFCILDDYYSFFNYGVIEKVIGWFGTPEDKERLDAYTEHFTRFCKRRTFECPSDIFGHPVDKGKTNLVVKVEESWDPTEGCSLENVLRLHNSVAEILEVESETLHLCRIDKGCVELLFQVPSFVEEDIFPLSTEQERSLAFIGVSRLTCGRYSYPHSQELPAPQFSSHDENEVQQKPLLRSQKVRRKPPLLPGLRLRPSNSPKLPTPPLPQLASLGGGIMLEELSIGDKKYQFSADDLEDLGLLGMGTYGTTSKISHSLTQTRMAVKKIRARKVRESDKNYVMEAALILQAVNCSSLLGMFEPDFTLLSRYY